MVETNACETSCVSRKVGNALQLAPATPSRSGRCVTRRMVMHAPAVPRVSSITTGMFTICKINEKYMPHQENPPKTELSPF